MVIDTSVARQDAFSRIELRPTSTSVACSNRGRISMLAHLLARGIRSSYHSMYTGREVISFNSIFSLDSLPAKGDKRHHHRAGGHRKSVGQLGQANRATAAQETATSWRQPLEMILKYGDCSWNCHVFDIGSPQYKYQPLPDNDSRIVGTRNVTNVDRRHSPGSLGRKLDVVRLIKWLTGFWKSKASIAGKTPGTRNLKEELEASASWSDLWWRIRRDALGLLGGTAELGFGSAGNVAILRMMTDGIAPCSQSASDDS